jgi:penicillin V acylase-like amidase (Ntn superfamily)
MKSIILTATVLLLFNGFAFSCTTFCVKRANETYLGSNLDWSVGEGLIIINKKNVSKNAVEVVNPVFWVSKYGSISFSLFGREFPQTGMNEAGLAIGSMALHQTRYAKRDNRPELHKTQWVQYCLDNYSTVKEVINSDLEIRIHTNAQVKQHYLVCDKTGDCATIEFLNGKLVSHTKKTLPVKVLANDTYESSLRSLNGQISSSPPLIDAYYGGNSLFRFQKAAEMTRHFESKKNLDPIDYSFKILEAVAQGSFTKWSIVYDIDKKTAYLKTLYNKKRRYVELSKFDLSCNTDVMILDMNEKLSGNITSRLKKYTPKANYDHIEKSLREHSFLSFDLYNSLKIMSEFPEQTRCLK